MNTPTLQQIWDGLNAKGMGSDKGSVHSYLPVYEELFKPYRETAFFVVEIGVFKGDSLRMWKEYFDGHVNGFDCSDQPHGGMADLRPMIKDGWLIHIVDAENEDAISPIIGPAKIDIIIDDAGHDINQQLNLHRIWSKYVRPGGLYIIEDVQELDRDRHLLEPLGEIIDLRHVKGRYDDVLVICRP